MAQALPDTDVFDVPDVSVLPLLDRITLIELSDGMQAKRLYDELVLFVRSLNSGFERFNESGIFKDN